MEDNIDINFEDLHTYFLLDTVYGVNRPGGVTSDFTEQLISEFYKHHEHNIRVQSFKRQFKEYFLSHDSERHFLYILILFKCCPIKLNGKRVSIQPEELLDVGELVFQINLAELKECLENNSYPLPRNFFLHDEVVIKHEKENAGCEAACQGESVEEIKLESLIEKIDKFKEEFFNSKDIDPSAYRLANENLLENCLDDFVLGSKAYRRALGMKATFDANIKIKGNFESRRRALDLWATGNYATPGECAKDIHGELNRSLSTVTRYLKGVPKRENL